jgi:hypothetical protein
LVLDFKEKPGCVHTLKFPISSAERQHVLTFSHMIFSFESGLITSFQGDVVLSMTLARFLRPFSCYGRSLSPSTSGADRPLIARVTSDIPDKGQVMVRYYGLYANAHRGKVKKALIPSTLMKVVALSGGRFRCRSKDGPPGFSRGTPIVRPILYWHSDIFSLMHRETMKKRSEPTAWKVCFDNI